MDAYTSKEETCFSVRVRAKHLRNALSILADMITNPLFDPQELDRERQVILEEIKMEEDNPEENVYEQSLRHFWSNHSIGRPILGTSQLVEGFGREQVTAFHRRYYGAPRFIVVAAGKVDHGELTVMLEDLFPQRPALDHPERVTPDVVAHQVYMPNANLEQVNFCIHFEGVAYPDPRRDALALLSTILGGGMSSRLFQKIREERGLAYSIASYATPFSDCGQLSIFGGCLPERFDEVMGLVMQELRTLVEQPVSQRELNRAIELYAGSMIMSMESTTTRISNLARDWMLLGEVFDMHQTVARVEGMTVDHISAVAAGVIKDQTLGICALGKLPDQPEKPWNLGL